jgi:hypothetical protein
MHTPHTMDAMPPWRAFAASPAPSASGPRRWLGVVLRMVAGVAARIAWRDVTGRAAAGGEK